MKLAGKAHVFNQRSGGVVEEYKEYRVLHDNKRDIDMRYEREDNVAGCDVKK